MTRRDDAPTPRHPTGRARPAEPEPSVRLHERDGFVWPPRSAHSPSTADASPAASGPVEAGGGSIDTPGPTDTDADRARSWLGQVAQAWLEPEHAPFDVWAGRTAWSPDPLTRSCPRCGHTVGPSLHDPEGCHRCRETPSPVDRVLRLGDYAGDLRLWVHRVKFGRDWHAGVCLGRRLGELALSQLALHAGEPGWPDRVRVVAVPSSWRRRWARAIDHTGAIAQGVAQACAAPLSQPIRRRHGPTQVGLSAAERARNVAGKFVPARSVLGRLTRPVVDRLRTEPRSSPGVVYLLVDDVLTTGATLRAASKALRASLKRSLPKSKRTTNKDHEGRVIVWGLIVGVTPDDRTRAT